MNDLLDSLQRFLEAGDESRYYQLNRDEVRLLLSGIEELRQGTVSIPVKVMSFEEIRNEVKLKRKAEAIARGIDAEIREFRPKDAS